MWYIKLIFVIKIIIFIYSSGERKNMKNNNITREIKDIKNSKFVLYDENRCVVCKKEINEDDEYTSDCDERIVAFRHVECLDKEY